MKLNLFFLILSVITFQAIFSAEWFVECRKPDQTTEEFKMGIIKTGPQAPDGAAFCKKKNPAWSSVGVWAED